MSPIIYFILDWLRKFYANSHSLLPYDASNSPSGWYFLIVSSDLFKLKCVVDIHVEGFPECSVGATRGTKYSTNSIWKSTWWLMLKTSGATRNPEFPRTRPDRTETGPESGTFLRIFSGRVGLGRGIYFRVGPGCDIFTGGETFLEFRGLTKSMPCLSFPNWQSKMIMIHN